MDNSFKQPLSLKWKWSILLLVSLVMLSGIGLFSYSLYSHETQLRYQETLSQRTFDKIIDFFHELKEPLVREDFQYDVNETNNSELVSRIHQFLQYTEDDETSIRVFNKSDQLLYETRNVEIPSQRYSPKATTIKNKNGYTFVASETLFSKDKQEVLGTIEVIVKPAEFNTTISQQRARIWWIWVLIAILSGVISIAISHYLLRPLQYLNNTLDLVEEESLSEIRIRKPRGNDEWSDLNVHINRLLDRIDLYVGNQKQFVEDVSHELRTPVAIVEGHMKMLNRWGKNDPEILEESISASLQEITRMKDLVQEMLDLSRADHANVDYKDEITEVYSTVQQVYNNFVILHPDFKFYLDSEKDGKELYIKMYRNHFEQVLIILLDNAVKYSLDRREIHIAVSKSFTKVEIAVQDFGEGMTEEDKQRVFGRFYRVDKARSRNKGGNGLGLSIAKQLVEGYKGHIHVESVLKHGSIFYVELPIIVDQSEVTKHQQIAIKKSI